MEKTDFKFEVIPLNLQQGMIRATGLSENTVNQVVAIYSYHRKLALIWVDWKDEEYIIRSAVPMETFTVQYADSFHIDTWDRRFDKFQDICPNCNETGQKGNYCTNCGESL